VAGDPAPAYAPQAPTGAPGYAPPPPTGLVQVPGIGTAQVASIGQRLGARAIDLGLVLALYFLLALIIYGMVEATDLYFFDADPLIAVFWFALWLVYEWLFIALRGATIGKQALGITVIDQRNGGRLGLGPAFVRQLIPMGGLLVFVVGMLVVYLSPIFDNSGRMQGWHDKAANDLVILKPK
jgi:uncharacterized RDD family membrane protein YckC